MGVWGPSSSPPGAQTILLYHLGRRRFYRWSVWRLKGEQCRGCPETEIEKHNQSINQSNLPTHTENWNAWTWPTSTNWRKHSQTEHSMRKKLGIYETFHYGRVPLTAGMQMMSAAENRRLLQVSFDGVGFWGCSTIVPILTERHWWRPKKTVMSTTIV